MRVISSRLRASWRAFFLMLLGGVTLLLHHLVVFLNEGAELLSQYGVSPLNFSEIRVELLELRRARVE